MPVQTTIGLTQSSSLFPRFERRLVEALGRKLLHHLHSTLTHLRSGHSSYGHIQLLGKINDQGLTFSGDPHFTSGDLHGVLQIVNDLL